MHLRTCTTWVSRKQRWSLSRHQHPTDKFTNLESQNKWKDTFYVVLNRRFTDFELLRMWICQSGCRTRLQSREEEKIENGKYLLQWQLPVVASGFFTAGKWTPLRQTALLVHAAFYVSVFSNNSSIFFFTCSYQIAERKMSKISLFLFSFSFSSCILSFLYSNVRRLDTFILIIKILFFLWASKRLCCIFPTTIRICMSTCLV